MKTQQTSLLPRRGGLPIVHGSAQKPDAINMLWRLWWVLMLYCSQVSLRYGTRPIFGLCPACRLYLREAYKIWLVFNKLLLHTKSQFWNLAPVPRSTLECVSSCLHVFSFTFFAVVYMGSLCDF